MLVGAALWIMAQPGTIDVQWREYSIEARLGVALLALAVLLIALVFLARIAGAILSLPQGFSRYRKESRRKKGYRALTRGFVAIAAGDTGKAAAQAKLVRELLPDEGGLPLLLEAQAARLKGDEASARRIFEKLIEDKDAAFFGIRGLLKAAMEERHYERALDYAYQAVSHHPKQGWILKTVYDLELKTAKFEEASRTLQKLKKLNVVTADQARSDETVLLIMMAQQDDSRGEAAGALKKLERAVKLRPGFVPAAVRLAGKYRVRDKKGKAADVIELAWKENPHPDLLALWDALAPENTPSDTMRRLRWYEKLVAIKPDSVQGQVAAAAAAIEGGMWGQARAYLAQAENLVPKHSGYSAQLYRLRAKLEEKTTNDEKTIRRWLEKASESGPEPVWYCALTGNIYQSWHAFAPPHGSFNTIVWGDPAHKPLSLSETKSGLDPLMIETVRA